MVTKNHILFVLNTFYNLKEFTFNLINLNLNLKLNSDNLQSKQTNLKYFILFFFYTYA